MVEDRKIILAPTQPPEWKGVRVGQEKTVGEDGNGGEVRTQDRLYVIHEWEEVDPKRSDNPILSPREAWGDNQR